MLIVGAKGFAKEVLEIIHPNTNDLVFYDDINEGLSEKVFGKFPIYTNTNQAEHYFNETDNRFVLGFGSPKLRAKISKKFSALNGVLTSTISKNSTIGSYDVVIGRGTNVFSGAIISNSVKIGEGCIIYYNVIVTHDCIINNYVEISPGAKILGRVTVGKYTHIGANATILPDLRIGSNVIVGAGAVVTKDVPDNCVVAGIPAVIIKNTK